MNELHFPWLEVSVLVALFGAGGHMIQKQT